MLLAASNPHRTGAGRQWATTGIVFSEARGKRDNNRERGRAFTTKYTKAHEGKRMGMRMDDWIKATRKFKPNISSIHSNS
jgi:hypothetical protein